MHFHISRNGQIYGPYTLADLQRYVTAGNILMTDMAKSDEMPEWVPVSQVLSGAGAPPTKAAASGTVGQGPAFAPGPAYAAGSPVAYEDPPDLHWGLVLLLGILTGGAFVAVWDLVIAVWLKKVQPNTQALGFYVVATVLVFLHLAILWHHRGYHYYPGGHHPLAGVIGLASWIMRLVARFTMRSSLEEHFNGPEPIGLQLSGVMTFFFGGLYFTYHLNRINRIKAAIRYQNVAR